MNAMSATAVTGANATQNGTVDRARALGRMRVADRSFFWMTIGSALIVLILLAGVTVSLFVGAWPAFREFGFNFFVSDAWSPPREQFGAATASYGTRGTSMIVRVIGVPVGLGIAVFLTEL